ncbi:hypothetical protein [Kitasatospora sp. NPDC004289]
MGEAAGGGLELGSAVGEEAAVGEELGSPCSPPAPLDGEGEAEAAGAPGLGGALPTMAGTGTGWPAPGASAPGVAPGTPACAEALAPPARSTRWPLTAFPGACVPLPPFPGAPV